MKDYEYQELIEIVSEVFSDFRKDAIKIGENTIQVLARFFDNYDCVINEGDCEANIVCSTICIQLFDIDEKAIYKSHYDKLINVLKKYDPLKMVGYITENEIELLTQQVIKSIRVLEGMKVII